MKSLVSPTLLLSPLQEHVIWSDAQWVRAEAREIQIDWDW